MTWHSPTFAFKVYLLLLSFGGRSLGFVLEAFELLAASVFVLDVVFKHSLILKKTVKRN